MFQTPITVMLKLTVPVVDYEAPLNNWNKDLHVLHCVTGPVVAVFLADYTGKLRPHSTRLLVLCGLFSQQKSRRRKSVTENHLGQKFKAKSRL